MIPQVQPYFVLLLALSAVCVASFKIDANKDDFVCKPTKIQCLSDTTFTSCTDGGSIIMLVKAIIKCPEGYVCNDDANEPCVLQSDPAGNTSAPVTDAHTTTTTTTTASTTVAPTTRFTVERPTETPSCKDESTYPAPLCNQYYVCQKKNVLFVKWYEPVLYTCDEGYEFSSTLLRCVLPSQSDCP